MDFCQCEWGDSQCQPEIFWGVMVGSSLPVIKSLYKVHFTFSINAVLFY